MPRKGKGSAKRRQPQTRLAMAAAKTGYRLLLIAIYGACLIKNLKLVDGKVWQLPAAVYGQRMVNLDRHDHRSSARPR